MARAVGAKRPRDENTVHKRSDYSMICSGPTLEVFSEDKVVSAGSDDDVCCLCGGRFAFLDQLTDRYIKHTDEVCCHLCPTKFPHINSLASHIKSVHPNDRKVCNRCYMGQRLSLQWTVKNEASGEMMEEVITETMEVEIKEEDVEKMETTEENRVTEPPEDDKMFKRDFHDHNYFSTQACGSVGDTANNVVMYTSNENVLVVINKTDTGISPKDSYTESDQQGTPVGDQTGIQDDHTYFSPQSLAEHILPVEHVPAHTICSAFSKTTDNATKPSTETWASPKDPESSGSQPDQEERHESVHSNSLDHTYDFRQCPESHSDLPKQEPKISCEEMADAVGAERPPDENTVNGRNEYSMICSGPTLEVFSEDKVVSAGSDDDVCCLCGGRFAFLDQLTDRYIKHTDEVCCHLCPTKFPHINSLASHIKSVHPNDRKVCNRCYMGQRLSLQWTVKNEASGEMMEEVITETMEVEIKEEDVEKMETTEENRVTEPPEDDKMFKRDFHDHNYFSTQACGSVGDTANNVVMYTSNENVLVVINKTDTGISPKDSYTESDQQGTPVGDQTGIQDDHTYFSPQSLAEHILPVEHVPAHTICSAFSKTTDNATKPSTETWASPKDLESSESQPDQEQRHESVHSNSLDHTYDFRQCPESHSDLPKQEPSNEETLKEHGNNVTVTDQESSRHSNTAVSLQLGCDIKVKEELKPVQKSARIGEHVERVGGREHQDCHTSSVDDSQDAPCSGTMSSTSTSTGTYSDILNRESRNVAQKADGQPLVPVGSVNSNSDAGSYKPPQICSRCGCSQNVMERCKCTRTFSCSLCAMVFGTEQTLLTHQAEKHPAAKYICSGCMQLFPNKNIFMQHVCSKSARLSGESVSPSNVTNGSKEPPLMILKLVPLPAAVESCKQPSSCQNVSTTRTAPNPGTGNTFHSLPNSPSTPASQKTPVHVKTTRLSGFAQSKKVTCCMFNGDQRGQVTAPISTVTEKPKRPFQLSITFRAKAVPQTTTSLTPPISPSSSSSSSSAASSPKQVQPTPIRTVNQTKSGQIRDSTPITLPQQGVCPPQPALSQVSSSVSNSSQTEASAPFLDISRYSPSTQILPSSQGPLKIVAMVVNQSRELALQKRMRQSWRSKAVFPCRRCGAVSRQFSLGVRHRYQHRGPRLYRCQCGRTFHQRMHLLRHQVQHAEATSYICTACGQMFCGTKLLACHRPLFRTTQSKRKKCRNRFRCYCGHSFTRPAALLWHMLKNSKAHKPCGKAFGLV